MAIRLDIETFSVCLDIYLRTFMSGYTEYIFPIVIFYFDSFIKFNVVYIIYTYIYIYNVLSSKSVIIQFKNIFISYFSGQQLISTFINNS